MSDATYRDAALAELEQTTVGWVKPNGLPRYPSGQAPMSTHWGQGMYQLGLISLTNAAIRNTAIGYLKKTTKGYTPSGTYWKLALTELAKITDVVIYPANTLYPSEVAP